MNNQMVETIIGAIVVVVAAVFLWFAYGQTEQAAGPGYTLSAQMDNATGIGAGTDVRIAGIKVGTVTSTELDPLTYTANIVFTVQNDVELPEDSSIRIAQEGLFGGSFVQIQVGGDFENLLADGDEIVHTQGSIDIIGLIQRAMFGGGNGNGDE
jgi:phospholipid/cholesterol/gamma-HCH transport system substrate-binding protein